MEHKITTTIATTNNLPYLKLAIESVRKNAYYKDMPVIVFAENCTSLAGHSKCWCEGLNI